MTIQNVQNKDHILLRIAAASRMYSIGKKFNNASLMLNVVLMSTITFLSLALNTETFSKFLGVDKMDISSWVAIASIIVLTLNNLFIGDQIDECKEKAAKIQDEVDRELFDLKWNQPLAGKPAQIADITKHGDWLIKKHGKQRFRDWYSLTSDKLTKSQQALICQNSCLSWDSSLRGKVNIVLLIIGVTIFVSATCFSLFLNLKTTSILTNIIGLLGPISDYGYTTYKSNKDSIENNNRLLEYVTEAINSANSVTEPELKQLVEKIQDQMFVKRKSDWPIPDKLYRMLRSSHENIMINSSAELERKFESRTP
ncbi:S-4TM family putative pore-forming effector [Pseudomonas sp. Pseusp122]|uniref:S-4TM family putative pore-forming effector n=1 Tax=unclassified Pseudomonas TaxID=196821 RepID=UPI0039A475A7